MGRLAPLLTNSLANADWTTAEELAEEAARTQAGSWYATGALITCRWVALASIRPRDGVPGYPAFAPVIQTSRMTYPELIEREACPAEIQLMRRPGPKFLQSRPDWAEGVDATFAWLWRRTARSRVLSIEL
jgi:hypothetical protein